MLYIVELNYSFGAKECFWTHDWNDVVKIVNEQFSLTMGKADYISIKTKNGNKTLLYAEVRP